MAVFIRQNSPCRMDPIGNFVRTSNKPDKGYHMQKITMQTLSRLNLQPEGWNGGIQIQQNGAYKMISKPDGGFPA